MDLQLSKGLHVRCRCGVRTVCGHVVLASPVNEGVQSVAVHLCNGNRVALAMPLDSEGLGEEPGTTVIGLAVSDVLPLLIDYGVGIVADLTGNEWEVDIDVDDVSKVVH